MRLLKIQIFFLLIAFFAFTGCKKEEEAEGTSSDTSAASIGVGPITELKLGEIDKSLVKKGKKYFEAKCSACHKFEERVVGPPLTGVTERRTPEWIMNMILNPEEMTKKDPAAKELFETYLIQMTNQNVTEADTRAILEYFRQMDKKK